MTTQELIDWSRELTSEGSEDRQPLYDCIDSLRAELLAAQSKLEFYRDQADRVNNEANP